MSNAMPESFVPGNGGKSYEMDKTIQEDVVTEQKTLNRRHNTMIVESLFSDNKFLKTLKNLLEPDIVKRLENRWAYGVVIFFAVLCFLPVTEAYFDFMNVMLGFLFYSMFLSGSVVKLWNKYYVWKFKNYFKTKENLVSFFDSLIDNKYLHNVAFKDVNLHSLYQMITDASQGKGTLDFYLSNFAMKTPAYNGLENVIEREKHLQYLKSCYYLQEWIKDEDDLKMKDFLKETSDYVNLSIKKEALNSPLQDKRNLIEHVFKKLGKK